jgi:hypothetical protein
VEFHNFSVPLSSANMVNLGWVSSDVDDVN